MAHFEVKGQRVSGQNVRATAGGPFEIGVWGPLDTFAFPPREVTVEATAPGSTLRPVRTRMQGNVAIWSVTGLRPGRETLAIKSARGETWDSVTLDIQMASPVAAAGAAGGFTWEQMFGAPYSGETVDLRRKRQPATGILPAIRALQDSLKAAAEPPATASQAWGRGALSPHNIGAALDIFYHKDNDRKRAYGFGLVKVFIANRTAMGWGYMSYARMNFTPSGVTAAPGDTEHDDHIHIDWCDYARTQYATTPASFQYYDENGALKTKTLSGRGQAIAMFYKPTANTGEFGPGYTDAIATLNRDFATIGRGLSAMTLADFQALY